VRKASQLLLRWPDEPQRFGTMQYLTRRPSPPLAGLVSYLWSLSDAPGHGRERIVPSGTIELVINLHSDEFRIFEPAGRNGRRFRGAIVSGCYSSGFDVDTRVHACILGVHFTPGGAARLLGVPPGKIANSHVALEDLWGPSAAEIRERLCAAPSLQQQMDLLELALIARLPDRWRQRPAVSVGIAELEKPGVEIGHIAGMLGLSRRRFIEVFSEDVGMTPKRFFMVRRFQRSLARALQLPSVAWAQLAVECGYFDQAHLCRDWVAFAGMSPGEFLALRAAQVKENHIALPKEGGQIRPRQVR
jgi:AraC-like DNA-binding protein